MKKSISIPSGPQPRAVALTVQSDGVLGQYVGAEVHHVNVRPRAITLMDRLMAEAVRLYQDHEKLR
jgi:hypothetical protein